MAGYCYWAVIVQGILIKRQQIHCCVSVYSWDVCGCVQSVVGETHQGIIFLCSHCAFWLITVYQYTNKCTQKQY